MSPDHYLAHLETALKTTRAQRDELRAILTAILGAHQGCTPDTCTTVAAIEGAL